MPTRAPAVGSQHCLRFARPLAGLVALVLLALWPVRARGMEALARVNDDTWQARLESGVTVLLRHVSGAPSVSLRAFVPGGSAHEGEYLGTGISYALERLVLGGSTENRSAADTHKLLQKAGAATDSYTTKNATVLHVLVPPAQLKTAATVLGDWLFASSLKAEEATTVLQAIHRELLALEQDEDAALQDLFYKVLFQTHPVRLRVMGYPQPMQSLDSLALIGHYRRVFTPGRVVVVAAGDFSAGVAPVFGQLKAAFGGVAARPAPPLELPAEPRPISPRTLELTGQGQGSRLLLGWHTSGADQEEGDQFALEVLTVLLSSGAQGLAPQGADGLVRATAHHLLPARGVSAFVLSAEVKGDGADAFLARTHRLLQQLAKGALEETALQAARRQLLSRLALSQLDVAAITDRLGNDYLATGDPAFGEVYRREVSRVSAADIARVVQRYFQARRQTLVVLRPPGAALKASPAPPRAPVLVESLGNGLKVLVKPLPGSQVVSLHLFARGGLAHETPHNSGLHRLFVRTLAMGGAAITQEQMGQSLARMGAQLETSSGHHALGLSLTVAKEDLEPALNLLLAVCQGADFGENHLRRAREVLNSERETQNGDWRVMAMKTLRANLWQKHPFRQDLSGTPQSLRALTRKDMLALQKKLLVGGNLTAAVFGDVDPARLAPVLEATLGKLPAGAAPALPPPRPETRSKPSQWPMQGPAGHVIHGLGFLAPGLEAKDLPAAMVLAGLLGGAGDAPGLLQKSLQSGQKPVADFVDVQLQPALGQGAMLFVFHTSPEQKTALEKAVQKELQTVTTRQVDEKLLAPVKAQLIALRQQGQMPLPEQARSSALDSLMGLGADYDERTARALEQVSAQDVLAVAKRLLVNPATLWVTP